MWVAVISAGFLIGEFVYHRWREKQDRLIPPKEVQFPQCTDGAAIPLIFGACRVRSPIIAWEYVWDLTGLDTQTFLHFICGVGMDDGNSNVGIRGMWGGDFKMINTGTTFSSLTGNGGPETPAGILSTGGCGTGHVELLNGNSSQTVANNGDDYTNAPTLLGRRMLRVMGWNDIPGYRGYISVFLCTEGGPNLGWINPMPGSIPAYSFEISSYKETADYPAGTGYGRIGNDANPANVLWDLLKAKFGKLGLSTAWLDFASFAAAAYTLYTELHGYSRAVESSQEGDSLIQEILEQIDGTLDEDPTTGRVRLKLIRPDFDPVLVPHITKANCSDLQNLAMGGWTGVVNKVRVVFTDRDRDYNEGSAYAINQANVVAQNDLQRELTIQMPGICVQDTADNVAARELFAHSRPVIKMTAICDRSLIRLMRGDAVKVTWNDPDISGMIFRVANVNRGTLRDGKVAVDLISDAFYTWRNHPPRGGNIGVLGDGGGILIHG